MTACNTFVFDPNPLPNLFTGWPEMTHSLPTKSALLMGGMGHAKPSGISVCHFWQKEFASHFLIGCCPHRQPNNNCPEEIGDKKKLETLPTLVLASLHWKVPRFILKDAQQYCSYSDTAQSNIKVMRKMEMKPGLFNKFSSPVPREMYREQ